jgi:biotin carboxyl carrier protein
VRYQVSVAGRTFEIEIDHERLVRLDGRPLYVDLEQVGGLPVYSLALDDAGYIVFVEEGQEQPPATMQYQVEVEGKVYPVEVERQWPHLALQRVDCPADREGCVGINAPLAGRLLALPVAVGEEIETGDVVAVVESMKMQMELKAPQAGVVETVHGPPERDVSQGQELVRLRAR